MRMIFRVEANSLIGRGHLSRMIAVAQMFEDDYSVLFIVSRANKAYCSSLLKSRATSYIEDENDLLDIVSKRDILWVDGYSFDNLWRLKFRPHVLKLFFVNDLPGDIVGADAIFNHCPGIVESQYVKYDGTRYFLGLEYPMLRPTFLQRARKQDVSIAGSGVFVCFGGADPECYGLSFVNSILRSGFSDPIYLVTPSVDPEVKGANLKILKSLSEEEMIRYMDLAAVVVVSASILSFEAIALRRPLFTVYYVENQELIYQGFTSLEIAVGGGIIRGDDDIRCMVTRFNSFYKSKRRQEEIVANQMALFCPRGEIGLKKAVGELLGM